MREYAEVSPALVARLGRVCLGLPEAYEEPAWVGVRWRVRKRTFAHVLTISQGWPPAYARATGTSGPATLLTFRASEPELQALTAAGHPYFRPGWGRDVVGLVLGDGVDWEEVAELVTESFCVQAPQKLVRLVGR